jgi:hypothetical protein
MTSLLVLVEGQTEEAVVNVLLRPLLAARDVHAKPVIVLTQGRRGQGGGRGGGRWRDWRAHLERLLRHSIPGQFVTTLFDLYGLPSDFPRYAQHMATGNTQLRAVEVENEIGAAFGHPPQLLPYVQRHELEALLLVNKAPLERRFPRLQVDSLWRDLRGLPPEEVNCGSSTAPSKRVLRHIPDYKKAVHGPAVLGEVGLPAIRAACPRFDAWVSRLELLGG